MDCGCVKKLGCFSNGQMIGFGVVNPTNNTLEYKLQIFGVNGYSETNIEVEPGEEVKTPFVFNEVSETMLKLKLPDELTQSGINYVTTADGACCFVVSGVATICF